MRAPISLSWTPPPPFDAFCASLQSLSRHRPSRTLTRRRSSLLSLPPLRPPPSLAYSSPDSLLPSSFSSGTTRVSHRTSVQWFPLQVRRPDRTLLDLMHYLPPRRFLPCRHHHPRTCHLLMSSLLLLSPRHRHSQFLPALKQARRDCGSGPLNEAGSLAWRQRYPPWRTSRRAGLPWQCLHPLPYVIWRTSVRLQLCRLQLHVSLG